MKKPKIVGSIQFCGKNVVSRKDFFTNKLQFTIKSNNLGFSNNIVTKRKVICRSLVVNLLKVTFVPFKSCDSRLFKV